MTKPILSSSINKTLKIEFVKFDQTVLIYELDPRLYIKNEPGTIDEIKNDIVSKFGNHNMDFEKQIYAFLHDAREDFIRQNLIPYEIKVEL